MENMQVILPFSIVKNQFMNLKLVQRDFRVSLFDPLQDADNYCLQANKDSDIIL